MLKKITLALVAFVMITTTGIAVVQTAEARGLQTLRNDVRNAIQTSTGPTEVRRNLSRVERRVYSQPSKPLSTKNVPTTQPPTPITHQKTATTEHLVTPTGDPQITEETNKPNEEAPVFVATLESEEVPTPSTSYFGQIVSEVHRLTNEERIKVGLTPLKYDPALARVATAHSEDMAQNDYFSHVTPEGCTLACRLDQANYSASTWGENIIWVGRSTLPDAATLAEYFVDSWMNSPSHKENILRTTFTHEGIGLAQIGSRVYATANFSTPK